jgi:hypothetical protein
VHAFRVSGYYEDYIRTISYINVEFYHQRAINQLLKERSSPQEKTEKVSGYIVQNGLSRPYFPFEV